MKTQNFLPHRIGHIQDYLDDNPDGLDVSLADKLFWWIEDVHAEGEPLHDMTLKCITRDLTLVKTMKPFALQVWENYLLRQAPGLTHETVLEFMVENKGNILEAGVMDVVGFNRARVSLKHFVDEGHSEVKGVFASGEHVFGFLDVSKGVLRDYVSKYRKAVTLYVSCETPAEFRLPYNRPDYVKPVSDIRPVIIPE